MGAQLDPLHRNRADPGLNQALRAGAVPHDALAPVWQPLAFHQRQEGLVLRLDSLGQQSAAWASSRRAPLLKTAVSGSSISSG